MSQLIKDINWYRLLRYLIIGSLNAGLSLSIYYAGLVLLDLPYYAASALSVIFGVVTGFKAHGAFVFKGDGSFVRYVCIWTTLYLANILSIWLIRDFTGDYWEPIILLPITVITSYFLLKKLIYKVN